MDNLVDARVLRVLEFDKIRAKLADCASTSLGRQLAEKLEPSTDERTVRSRQQETTEAVRILERCGRPPFGGLADISRLTSRARLGGVLYPDELVAIGLFLRAVRKLQAYLREAEVPGEIVPPLGERLVPLGQLESEIWRCIGEDGEIRDEASEILERIRLKSRSLQARLKEKLESIVKSPSYRKLLQEPIVTLRNGRYVIPVKQEYRSLVSGIVHDQSASGATVFVEPGVVVDLNNQLKQLEAEEKREIERILRSLSSNVGGNVEALEQDLSIVAGLDFIFAKAIYSLDSDCVEPEISKSKSLELRRARHPLITHKPVPIDIWLGDAFDTLIITGPNTGGKTVALKTVGLLAVMAQSGLHVPAVSARIPVFSGVYADIGDEQSIEQSLSTFSSHMTTIVDIINRVGPNCLVLLDELGAGTDPSEGAALARAILSYLHEIRCLTVATTHYSELKTFAYLTDGVENASVEFDSATLKPTYSLSIGLPGRSNAFEIALRIGLRKQIVERARSYLNRNDLRMDDMIRDIELQQRESARNMEDARRLKQRYESLVAEYEAKLARLNEEKSSLLANARREAEEIVRTTRAEMDRLVGELRKAGEMSRAHSTGAPGGDGLSEFEVAARELRDAARQWEKRLGAGADEERAGLDRDKTKPGVDLDWSPVPGQNVTVRTIGQTGRVLAPPDSGGLVKVAVGSMNMMVPVADLSPAGTGSEATERGKSRAGRGLEAPGRAGISTTSRLLNDKVSRISPELHVRGMTGEEAVEATDKYLDDALLAGLQKVRIVHGKGTGALRKAIQEYLKEHPHVARFGFAPPNLGGDGVTEVEFSGGPGSSS